MSDRVNFINQNENFSLFVAEKIASDDACKMEHVLSKQSFEAIKRHIKI